MNYKETLFFIGKCLTISRNSENFKSVAKQIQSQQIDWDRVVQLSTTHYVFPALYSNLSKTDLLHHLPQDLVAYMKHISELNRERNLAILEQAEEINQLLKSHDITPVFLKGTGFLLQQLYDDISERMIGDIDILIAQEHLEKTMAILGYNGYSRVYKSDDHAPLEKHYPRIQKEGKIAAVEVHFDMVKGRYKSFFNHHTVCNSLLELNNFSLLSLEHQLVFALIVKQINDDGQYYKTMSLRNGYDVFLLSEQVNSLNAIKKHDTLFDVLNPFLALCYQVFCSPSLVYESNSKTQRYLQIANQILHHKHFRTKHHRKVARRLFLTSRLAIIFKAFYKKEYLLWLYKRLKNGRSSNELA